MKMQIKKVDVITLATGDKQGEIVLRTLYPEDVSKLAELLTQIEIDIDFVVKKD